MRDRCPLPCNRNRLQEGFKNFRLAADGKCSHVESEAAETVYPKPNVPVAPDRRGQDRVLTNLPIRILAVDGNPVYYPAVCTNLSRGGMGFETTSRLEVGEVIEFEFVQVTDETVQYWLRILFRDNNRYGGYYVNDDGTDIRPSN